MNTSKCNCNHSPCEHNPIKTQNNTVTSFSGGNSGTYSGTYVGSTTSTPWTYYYYPTCNCISQEKIEKMIRAAIEEHELKKKMKKAEKKLKKIKKEFYKNGKLKNAAEEK